MNASRFGQTLAAGVAGFALAAICKLTYDMFNGYALIPNLLLGIGASLPPSVLEALMLCCLFALSFIVGTLLLQKTKRSRSLSAAVAALPWIALSVLSVSAGILGEHGPVLQQSAQATASGWGPTLLATLSVPAGLLFALRRLQKCSDA